MNGKKRRRKYFLCVNVWDEKERKKNCWCAFFFLYVCIYTGVLTVCSAAHVENAWETFSHRWVVENHPPTCAMLFSANRNTASYGEWQKKRREKYFFSRGHRPPFSLRVYNTVNWVALFQTRFFNFSSSPFSFLLSFLPSSSSSASIFQLNNAKKRDEKLSTLTTRMKMLKMRTMSLKMSKNFFCDAEANVLASQQQMMIMIDDEILYLYNLKGKN